GRCRYQQAAAAPRHDRLRQDRQADDRAARHRDRRARLLIAARSGFTDNQLILSKMPATQPKMIVDMLSLIKSRCLPLARRLAADERGFSAILTGIAATVLLGFGGLAVDVGYWQWNPRTMQGTADQAPFA